MKDPMKIENYSLGDPIFDENWELPKLEPKRPYQVSLTDQEFADWLATIPHPIEPCPS